MVFMLPSLALILAPQLAPVPNEIERGAFGAEDIEYADLDGDGFGDLVVPSSEGALVWFPGVGPGAADFGRPVTIASELGGADWIAVADLDGDGVLDVTVADTSGGRLSWHRGLGGGELDAGQTIDAAVPGVSRILAEDLDGDGAVDLAGVVAAGAAPVVWYGSGAGAFQPRVVLAALGAASGPADMLRAADLNGDGRVDLVSSEGSTLQIQAHLVDASGSFGVPIVVGAISPMFMGLDVGDIDNDGHLDVVGVSSSQLFRLINDGAAVPGFQPLQILFIGYARDVLLVDVIGDGFLDAVTGFGLDDLRVRSGSSGFSSVWGMVNSSVQGFFLAGVPVPRAGGGHDLAVTTLGSVQMARAAAITPPSTGGGVAEILTERIELSSGALVDVNGDGELDLVATDSFELQLRLGQGGGAFGPPASVGPSPATRTDVVGADFDGDGFGDVVCVLTDSLGQRRSVVWRRGSTTGLGPAVDVDPVLSGLSFAEVPFLESADVDGDGDLDLVATELLIGQRITGYYVFDNGAFQPDFVHLRQNFDVEDIADVNGDGRADFLLARRGVWSTLVIESDPASSGYLQERQLLGVTRDFGRFVDVDDDGDLDVVRTNRSGPGDSGDLEWFERIGSTYDPAPRLLVADVGELVHGEPVDLDGDGDRDLLVGTRFVPPGGGFLEPALVELLNNGPAGWSQGAIVDEQFGSAPEVVLADLDRDGNLDVVTGGDRDYVTGLPTFPFDRVRWYEFTGRVDDPVCDGVTNSTGLAAALEVGGSDRVADNRLVLSASQLPPQAFILFAVSRTQGLTPGAGGSQGDLCLGGSIGRFVAPGQVQAASPMGRVSLKIDLTALPLSVGSTSAMAGETLFFQGWYRDTNPLPTSNFTSARSISLR